MFSRRAKSVFLDNCTQEILEAFVAYNDVQYSWMSALDIVAKKPLIALAYARRPLSSPGVLLNIQSFPIGVSYTDRDYLGSEGAD